MKVLLTGVDGFIGARLARHLLAEGHQVYGLVRPGSVIKRVNQLHQLELVEANLQDGDGTQRVIDQIHPEAAVHLAWYAVHGKFWTAPENLDCVSMTLGLAKSLAAAGCHRLIGAGTCAEYDWNAHTFSEESTPVRPGTLYGICKDATRRILSGYCAETSMSFAWARIFFVYGPAETPSRLIPSVTQKLIDGEPVELSHGKQIRDFLHVDDAAVALSALLKSTANGPVNIGSGQPVSLRAVAETLARLLDRQPETYLKFGARPSHSEPPVLVADIQKITRETGWAAEIGLEEGLRQTIHEMKTRR